MDDMDHMDDMDTKFSQASSFLVGLSSNKIKQPSRHELCRRALTVYSKNPAAKLPMCIRSYVQGQSLAFNGILNSSTMKSSGKFFGKKCGESGGKTMDDMDGVEEMDSAMSAPAAWQRRQEPLGWG
jgi:hypothetical protein